MVNAKVNNDELSLLYRAGRGIREQVVPRVATAVGTGLDIATGIPRSLAAAGQEAYAGFRGQPAPKTFETFPFSSRLREAVTPQAAPDAALPAPLPMQRTGAIPQPAQPGEAVDLAPAPATAQPQLTGIHAARDESGYVVPSKFKNAAEAEEFRKFQTEMLRSDRPSVGKSLQRDPVTGEYWTQEWMQGGDIDYAATPEGIRKGYASAELTEAQAEAVPITTESLKGFRGAQAISEEAKRLMQYDEEIPTGEFDALGAPIMTKQTKFFDPVTRKIVAPDKGVRSALPAKKDLVVGKYYELPRGRFKWTKDGWVK